MKILQTTLKISLNGKFLKKNLKTVELLMTVYKMKKKSQAANWRHILNAILNAIL